MIGKLLTVGEGKDAESLFYFSATRRLLVEIMKKRHGVSMKYLLQLVDQDGNPVLLPPGCHFQLLATGQEVKLLEVHAPHLDEASEEN